MSWRRANFYKDEVAGWMILGGCAHALSISIEMGHVQTEFAKQKEKWSIELLAKMLSALMQESPCLKATPAICAANKIPI